MLWNGNSVRLSVTRLGEIIREKEIADAEIMAAVKKLEKLLQEDSARTDAALKAGKSNSDITHWNYDTVKDVKPEPAK